jgi:MoxR-like ATPase
MKTHQVKLDSNELKDFLNHMISNNRHIQAEGKNPVSVEIIGESGLGKTSSVIQLAEEQKLNFVKLNLAQIEELGDLVGFPIRQFKLIKEAPSGIKIQEWIDEHAVEEYVKQGYKFTGQKRMSYCPPEWIADKQGGGILLLDDWNRA